MRALLGSVVILTLVLLEISLGESLFCGAAGRATNSADTQPVANVSISDWVAVGR